MTWLASLTNLSIRAFSLAARFLLSIFMVKYLALDEIGMFGLVVSVTAGAPAVLGLGLNYFINREIITMPTNVGIAHLRDRLVITLCSSLAVAAAFAIGISLYGQVPSLPSLWLLLPVFVLETMALDLHFGLISVKRSVLANVLLFFRSAIWVYPFMLIAWISPELRDLSSLLAFWLGGQVAMVLVLYISSRDWRLSKLLEKPLNLSWVWSFSNKTKLIYASDIAIFLTMFSDRFILGGILGLSDLGIYVFCATIAGSIYLLTSAAIIQNLAPILVEAVKVGSAKDLKKLFYSQLRNAMLVAVTLSILMLFVFHSLVAALERPSLNGNNVLLFILLFSGVMRLCSDAFSQLMYALHLDKQWSIVNLFSMMIALAFISVLAPMHGMIGAALATSISGIITVIMRQNLTAKEMKLMSVKHDV